MRGGEIGRRHRVEERQELRITRGFQCVAVEWRLWMVKPLGKKRLRKEGLGWEEGN